MADGENMMKPTHEPLNIQPASVEPKLEPSAFTAQGKTQEVLAAVMAQIVAESHFDLPLTLAKVTFGPSNGWLAVLDNAGKVSAKLAYTWHAFRQGFDRAGALDAPKGALASAAYYLNPNQRSRVWAETRERGHKTKTVVLRTAIDTKGRNIDGQVRHDRYVRAVVSERHSAENGDDALFFTSLATTFGKGELSNFRDGEGHVYRDPASTTQAYFESRMTIGALDARLTVGVRNSEVGMASASAGWAMTFRLKGERDGQTHVIRVDLPVRRQTMYSRHVGSTIRKQIAFLEESSKRVQPWVMVALDTLQEQAVSDRQAARTRGACIARIPDTDKLGNTRTDEQKGELVNEAFAMVSKALHMSNTTALVSVLVLAHLGDTNEAQRLMTEMCGECA